MPSFFLSAVVEEIRKIIYNDLRGINMLQQDYHVHCLNSPDSREPLDEICKGAIAAGLAEIMVTDHYEMFTDAYGCPAWRPGHLDQCRDSVEKCRELFDGQLYVGFGIELGQWHLQPEDAARVTREYPFDFVIASNHKMDDVDLKFLNYGEMDRKLLRRKYLEGLLQIAMCGDFDCLGHLDLIKRYAAGQGFSIRAEDEEELTRTILETLVKRGKGLELNTSGLRQSVKEMFPSRTILEWYREEGGEIITVGSDAHCRPDVAAGFSMAEAMLTAVGFREISCFRKRREFRKRIG